MYDAPMIPCQCSDVPLRHASHRFREIRVIPQGKLVIDHSGEAACQDSLVILAEGYFRDTRHAPLGWQHA